MADFKKFTGLLNEKLPANPVKKRGLGDGYSGDGDVYVGVEKLRSELEGSKWLLLFEHYGIDESSEYATARLVIALSRQFVPGFQVETDEAVSVGRKQKWNDGTIIDLYHDVNRVRKTNSKIKSLKKACDFLAKSEKWASFIQENSYKHSDPDPGETLRQKFYKYPDVMQRLDEEAKRYDALIRLCRTGLSQTKKCN